MEFNNFPGLSEREAHVLRLATKGFTDKEICLKLEIAQTTIRTYWMRIRTKLKAVNRAQAIAEAMARCVDSKATESCGTLETMMDTAGISMIDISLQEGTVGLYGSCLSKLGFSADRNQASYESLLEIIAEEDRTRFHQAVLSAVTLRNRLTQSVRMVAKDGSVHSIGFFGAPTGDGEGEATRLSLAVTDLGALSRLPAGRKAHLAVSPASASAAL